MKKLLSLPPNLVGSFHTITNSDPAEWFCASDPIGARLGSGGGTTWILERCYRNEQTARTFEEWLAAEKRIILHAGGQSRRLPGYAPSGKILTPIPVFRWARGQKLSQDLLSLQLPLYEEIMRKAPDSLHTLIASGDVYLRHNEPLQAIPEADVVCYAINEAIDQGARSWSYIHGILKSYSAEGVRSIDDIRRREASFARRRKRTASVPQGGGNQLLEMIERGEFDDGS